MRDRSFANGPLKIRRPPRGGDDPASGIERDYLIARGLTTSRREVASFSSVIIDPKDLTTISRNLR